MIGFFSFSIISSVRCVSFHLFHLICSHLRCGAIVSHSLAYPSYVFCASISFGHWTCHIIDTFSNNSSILLFSRAFVHFTILKYRHRHDCCLSLLYLMPRPPNRINTKPSKKCLIHYPDMNCIVCYFHFYIYSHDSYETISFSLDVPFFSRSSVSRFPNTLLLCMVAFIYMLHCSFWVFGLHLLNC